MRCWPRPPPPPPCQGEGGTLQATQLSGTRTLQIFCFRLSKIGVCHQLSGMVNLHLVRTYYDTADSQRVHCAQRLRTGGEQWFCTIVQGASSLLGGGSPVGFWCLYVDTLKDTSPVLGSRSVSAHRRPVISSPSVTLSSTQDKMSGIS